MVVTFLKADQIWGDNALQVMKDYGTAVSYEDIATLCNSMLGSPSYKTIEGELAGYSWSASSNGNGDVRCVWKDGDKNWDYAYKREVASRPALPPSITSKIRPNAVRALELPNGKNINIAEYGHTFRAVPADVREEFLEISNNYKLDKSKKIPLPNNEIDTFELRDYRLRIWQDDLYLRITARAADRDSVLLDGTKVNTGEEYVCKAVPHEWLMDPTGWWVSKRCSFGGVPFDTSPTYTGDFDNTYIKGYMDKYHAKVLNLNIDDRIQNKSKYDYPKCTGWAAFIHDVRKSAEKNLLTPPYK
ncbi:MAG: hypothetical protein FWF23_05385 [Alphaproteobacteria bacterium]|nr:hypothetical protein [Alphaproteobacteria bacterium]